MTSERRTIYLWIAPFVIASFVVLPGAEGQRPAALSQFGASASSSGSAAATSEISRGTGYRGGSTWDAGKSSFGYSAQLGGVWRDGTTLGAAPRAGRGTTQARASAKDALPRGYVPPSDSLSATATGIRGKAAAGTTHLPRFSSGQHPGITLSGRGSVSKFSSMSHAMGRSRGRAASLGRRADSRSTRPSSGLVSRIGKPEFTREKEANYSLRSGLDMGVRKREEGPLP